MTPMNPLQSQSQQSPSQFQNAHLQSIDAILTQHTQQVQQVQQAIQQGDFEYARTLLNRWSQTAQRIPKTTLNLLKVMTDNQKFEQQRPGGQYGPRQVYAQTGT